ncbi:porin family protein [Fulvivirga kasyanovii]
MIAFVSATHGQIKLGVKAGANRSNLLSGDEDVDVDAKMGFHFGGYIDLSLSEKFSIQPELVYSTQGAKSEYSETVEDVGFVFSYSSESKVKLDYLNIPVLFKFKPAEIFYIGGGPQLGILLSAKHEYSTTFVGSGVSESESGQEDVKDELNAIDLSLAIGAGIELENGLNFGIRYNYGISDVADENDGDPIRNSVLQASVGYTILK